MSGRHSAGSQGARDLPRIDPISLSLFLSLSTFIYRIVCAPSPPQPIHPITLNFLRTSEGQRNLPITSVNILSRHQQPVLLPIRARVEMLILTPPLPPLAAPSHLSLTNPFMKPASLQPASPLFSFNVVKVER